MARSSRLLSRPRARRLGAALALAGVAAVVGGGPPSAHAGSARAEVPLRAAHDILFHGPGGPAMDVHWRPARSLAPAVLVIHGGAWQFGDKRRTRRVSRALARRGFVAFNVNYTLADLDRPGLARQPAEMRAAVRWIRAHGARFGADPRRIGALGTSAGGHLAALTATRGRGSLARGARVRAAVTWSAPFELPRFRTGWLWGAIDTFLGCDPAECEHRARVGSPTEHVSRDDPPMLIVNSRHEIVPAGQARRMAERLHEAGVDHRLRMLDGDRHGIEYARGMVGASAHFLARHLGRDD